MSAPGGFGWSLLRRLLPREDRAEFRATLDELFRWKEEREGRAAARRWYRREVWSALVQLPLERARTGMTRMGGEVMGWLRDLRLAFRRLGRTPGFTAAALITLSLGIGATTLVFSVVDRVALRPLPYPDPQELVAVWPAGYLTRGEYTVLARDSETLERVGLWIATDGFNLETEGGAIRVSATQVTPSLLTLLGVTPTTGRLFRPEESEVGLHRVALLSHGFWEERFGGSQDALGSMLRLDGESYEVVGVLPDDYAFTDPDQHLLLPVPLQGTGAGPLWGFGGYRSVGRLAPGASVAQADAELRRLALEAREENPVWTPPEDYRSDSRVVDLRSSMVGDVRTLLLVLLGGVGLLQLVVCANVANLLLTRGISRGRQSAVRAAMGALLAGSYARARLVAVMMMLFAGVTLILGCLGVYGVAAYSVRDRTREIGIRMALGAGTDTIRLSVLREGAILAGPGVLFGMLLAVPVSGMLDGLLFGVASLDPVTFLGVPLLLGMAALLAVYAPARRATRVDPARVLGAE